MGVWEATEGLETERGVAAEGWRDPKELELTPYLKPGRNALLVYATNTSQNPSPAGLIGAYRIELADGTRVDGQIDETWLTARVTSQNLWEPAEKVAPFGGGSWGMIGGRAQPQQADPFEGTADWNAAPDTTRGRVMLVMDGVREGARVPWRFGEPRVEGAHPIGNGADHGSPAFFAESAS